MVKQINKQNNVNNNHNNQTETQTQITKTPRAKNKDPQG